MLGFKVNEPGTREDPLAASFHGLERARQLKPDRVPLSPLFNINPYMREKPHDINTSAKVPPPNIAVVGIDPSTCLGGETLNHNIS